MIRHIVAIDSKRGMAKDHGMPPWKLKGDEAYFTDQTLRDGGVVLMGKKTLIEALHNKPLKDRQNYVATRDPAPIDGVTVINDLPQFVQNWPSAEVLWIIGGSEIFAQTMKQADELYITEIEGDFSCDKFYPEYLNDFELITDGERQVENDITYRFRIYKPKS